MTLAPRWRRICKSIFGCLGAIDTKQRHDSLMNAPAAALAVEGNHEDVGDFAPRSVALVGRLVRHPKSRRASLDTPRGPFRIRQLRGFLAGWASHRLRRRRSHAPPLG